MEAFKDIDSISLSEIQDRLNRTSDLNLPRLKVAFLRNITVNNLLPYLKYLGLDSGWEIVTQMGEYDNVMPETLDPASELYQNQPDFIILLFRKEKPGSVFNFRRDTKKSIWTNVLQHLLRWPKN